MLLSWPAGEAAETSTAGPGEAQRAARKRRRAIRGAIMGSGGGGGRAVGGGVGPKKNEREMREREREIKSEGKMNSVVEKQKKKRENAQNKHFIPLFLFNISAKKV